MKRSKPSPRKPSPTKPAAASGANRNDAPMRIIGGRMKNKKLEYSGDPLTRPMKERVREAVFNLIGPAIKGKHAIDLFAGTGALGLEALSRGAVSASFIERHVPTTKLIRENIKNLEVVDKSEIYAANTFIWARRMPEQSTLPWIVFCCPPYDFFVSRKEETVALMQQMVEVAPAESIFIIESDEQYDFEGLPLNDRWDVRRYSSAMVGILKLGKWKNP